MKLPGRARAAEDVPECPGVVALSPRRAAWVQSAAGPASDVVTCLAPGCRIVGVTKGQYGLTELLGAILRRLRALGCAPADFIGWAWSMGPDDARMMAGFRAEGLVRSMTVLFDRSFPTRHPTWVPMLRESLGANIYATNNHAKVLLVASGPYRLVVQSSMNFNINRRFEHFSVEDDPALHEHWSAITRWIVARTPAGLDAIEGAQFHEAFKAALGGDVPRARVSDDLDALLSGLDSSPSAGASIDDLLGAL